MIAKYNFIFVFFQLSSFYKAEEAQISSTDFIDYILE